MAIYSIRLGRINRVTLPESSNEFFTAPFDTNTYIVRDVVLWFIPGDSSMTAQITVGPGPSDVDRFTLLDTGVLPSGAALAHFDGRQIIEAGEGLWLDVLGDSAGLVSVAASGYRLTP